MFHIYRAAMNESLHPVSNLLIVGDLSYADTDPQRWTSWFGLMDPLLRHLPISVVAGNHEIECDTTNGNIFSHYENYFFNPNRIAPAEIEPVKDDYRQTLWQHSCATPATFEGHYLYGNAFYAYQHGLATIVVLSSYSDARVGSVQYRWLEDTLAAVDRTITPWIIVTFHSPLYTTFLGHYQESEEVRMKLAMEPLLVQYHVNLVVSGHDHAYMRTVPMAYDKADADGPVYLILGTGGNREQKSRFRNIKPEPWVAVRTHTDFGYGWMHIANATHAHFHWIRDEIEQYGVRDEVWFTNRFVSKKS
jgi:acid phosphatase type 7